MKVHLEQTLLDKQLTNCYNSYMTGHPLHINKPNFIATPIQNMVHEMSTGSSSFLKQLCTAIQHLQFTENANNDFAGLLSLVDCLLDASPSPIRDQWITNIHSFNNRKLFQAIGELVAIANLATQGWKVDGAQDGCIRLVHPQKGLLNLWVISMLIDRDLELEKRLQQELIKSLNQVDTPYQLAMTLRTPLSRHSSIEDIVQVTKKWLIRYAKKSKTTGSNKRKAKQATGFYKDDVTHIDFRVVGTKTTSKSSTITCLLPPVIGRQMHHHLQRLLSDATERLRVQKSTDIPTLLSVVSNQSLQLSHRAWKFLLYGVSKSESSQHLETALDTRHFGGWFQDPFRTFVAGIMQLEHNPNLPTGVPCFQGVSFDNPWSEFLYLRDNLPFPRYRASKSPSEITSPLVVSKRCLHHNWTLHFEEAENR